MDTTNTLSPYLHLLIYLVRSDGVIDDEETDQLLHLVEHRLGRPLEPELLEAILTHLQAEGPAQPSDAELMAAGQGLELSDLAWLVKDAYALAASDGEVHGAEIKTMRRYLRLAGVPTERFADIDHWARQPEAALERGLALLDPNVPSG